MLLFTEKIFSFFLENFPSLGVILTAGPLSIAWAYGCLLFSGYLRGTRGMPTGYTRKIFHALVFTSVAGIQWIWGTSVVCLFGGMTSLVLLYALLKGDGHPLYEALAREKDEPHRTFYIIAPYVATLAGGVITNIVVGQIAMIGYLVTGLGDAVGEPVGTKFGKRRYRVPSMLGIKAWRSMEGSAAVFAACLAAVSIGIGLCPQLELTSRSLMAIPLIGAASTLTEAVTPHGWDNATLQIVPSVMALYLL